MLICLALQRSKSGDISANTNSQKQNSCLCASRFSWWDASTAAECVPVHRARCV